MNIYVKKDDDQLRLDNWLKKYYAQLGFAQIQKLIRKGQVRIDGKRAKANTRLESGQELRLPPNLGNENQPQKAKLSDKDTHFIQSLVIYMDKDIIAINKPSGLAVQGGTKTTHHVDKLLPGLQFDYDQPPRLVHRLDRDTSGVLLLARHRQAAKELMHAFQQKEISKTYWAVVHNVPKPRDGVMECRMLKAKVSGEEKMTLHEDGKWSETEYEVKASLKGSYSWLELKPITGRTHQLRFHCAQMGCPIVNDRKYGEEEYFEIVPDWMQKTLCLHAQKMTWYRNKKKPLEIEADLPQSLQKTWKEFQWNLIQ